VKVKKVKELTMFVKYLKTHITFTLSHLLTFTLLTGCQIGGSGAFVQGESPEENNANYEGSPVTGDWVVMNLLDEPEGLNPLTSTSASARYIYGYFYESFIETRREPPWDEVPLLVESLPEISDDHLVYTWRLQSGVCWHDGHPLTMRDAEFTLKALINPYVDDLPTKPYYAELDTLKLLDDLTLRMFCSQSYFLHTEFLGGFSVLPRHIFDPDGLMADLSYFQVKHGSAYGRIADLLETEVDIAWEELYPTVALTGAKKSLGSVTNDKLDWNDLKDALPGLEADPPKVQLDKVLVFLTEHPDGAAGYRWLTELQEGIENATRALLMTGDITRKSGRERFPLRDSLTAVCRDIHDRIETFGHQFNTHPQGRAPTVGSGPYVFERWATGQEIVLKRNPDYWRGEGYAYLDKIVWRVLTDYTASLVALKNGEIDFMENLQTIQYLTMTNRRKFLDQFVKSTFTIPQYTYLGWLNSHPIFRDKRVRLAMTHMVRRRDVVDKLLFGFAEIVTGNFYRYGPDYDSTIVPYVYDPEEAQRLLTEAGWSDIDDDGILEKDALEFQFEMLIPHGSQFAEQLTSILCEDLYMIGIEMNIRRLEWSVFINNYIRNHNFDACYLGWVFGMKGDPKQVWHSESAKGRGSNHIEFRNAEADSLIDAARVEFDQTRRVEMYHRFQQILHEEQPYTFLFSAKSKPAYDKRFKGVRWYPFRPGYQLDEWFVPEEEQKYR